MAYIILAGDFPPQVGGIQSYHSNLARALAEMGREVRVIAVAQPGDQEHDLACPHEVTRVPALGSKWRQATHMAEAAVRVGRGLPPPRRGIIATKWSPEAYAAIQASRKLKAPWGVFGHDREFILTGLNPVKWAAQRSWLSRADFCFAISHYAADNFRRRGVRADRIRMVGSGVEAEAFAPDPTRAAELRHQLGLGDAPTLLTVSRLVRKKGHLDVLRGLPAALAVVPELRYVVVGEGECRAALEAAARALGLGAGVIFAGSARQADLPGYYTLADIVIMPSQDVPGEPIEGFGLVFLEANCCGTPVIGTRVGGIPDAVDHGVTGLLVPPGDPGRLAEAILRLLRDPGLARRMGDAGRRRALDVFRWELVARRVDACFAELMP